MPLCIETLVWNVDCCVRGNWSTAALSWLLGLHYWKTDHCCTTLDKIFPLQLVCVFMFRDDKLVPNCERYYCDAMCDSCVVPVSWINSIFLMGGGHNIWKALSVKRNIILIFLAESKSILCFKKHIYKQISLHHIAPSMSDISTRSSQKTSFIQWN